MARLPPFAALRAFEAAARHESFKEAALELGLTPTAISHQVKLLERISGQALFLRQGRRVELSLAGRDFAATVSPLFDGLRKAYARLCDGSSRQRVTLGAGPVFSARWLVPRLPDFWARHPGIDLRLHHSPLPVWQQMADLDLAVAWGKGDWPGMVSEPLLDIELAPVLAADLYRTVGPLESPEDLLSLPLFHHRDRSGWRQWFEAQGVAARKELPGTLFEDANVLLQAALSGRGVALGVLAFVRDELASGHMVQPFAKSVDPGEAYFLSYRPSAVSDEAVAAVKDWMLQSASRD